jgi:uncharacterized RDD family membrane protein YckC
MAMDDPDALEPTVAMPRVLPPQHLPPAQPVDAMPVHTAPVDVAPIAEPVPEAEIRPVAQVSGPVYTFGNPFTYVLGRFLAFVVDVVLVTAVATTIMYGAIAINPFTGLPNNSESGFDATFAMGLGIAFFYQWLFEGFFGTTFGKLAFSLHVYSPKRRIVGLGHSLIRNLLRPIDLCVIGWILALLPGHRRLGDLLGGTVVARSPLRSFAPLVGWIGIIMLIAAPFVISAGPVSAFAAGTAALEFIPRLASHIFNLVLQLFGGSTPHPATTTTG